MPRVGVRVQLFSAALLWAIGSGMLLLRGEGFLQGHWFAAIVALGIGAAKSRYLLDHVARKAVARMYVRGTACCFGFFSWKSWLYLATMIGGGILLRHTELSHDFLALLYLGVGSALLLSDRIFWMAALGRTPGQTS